MKVGAQTRPQPEQETSSTLTRQHLKPFTAGQTAHPVSPSRVASGNQAGSQLPHPKAEPSEADSDTSAANPFAHDFSRIPVHPKSPVRLQAKLVVNAPGDILEREADGVAEQVMRAPESQLRRICACGGGCPACRSEQVNRGRLQAKRVGTSGAGEIKAPPIVNQVLNSPGQPLDSSTREFMERRLGHDFSRVRVHTDSRAVESARSLGARAYTVGSDVVFGAGEYAPSATEGRRLLAHELTHVVQQSGMVQQKIQRQSIHNPLFPCMATAYLPGSMDVFGTLAHLAIQQHYVSSIDSGAATEYVIPGSGKGGYKDGRADIVSSKGGVYEIKPVGNTGQGFKEAEIYVSQAEKMCDPHVNWHLGIIYYPPKIPMIINNTLVFSWLSSPGVIAYSKKDVAPRRVPVKQPERKDVPTGVTVQQPRKQPKKQPEKQPEKQPKKQPNLEPGLTPLPGIPLPAFEQMLILEFIRKVVEEGVDPEQAAEELLQEHPAIAWAILILGTVGIIALALDDATLAGIADDVLIPPITVLMRVAWTFAF